MAVHQGPRKNEWYNNCSKYIKELIDIIEPKVIITLGEKAYNATIQSHHLNRPSL